MTRAVLLFVVSLLLLIEAQDPEHVFVLRGKDLYLAANKSGELSETADFFWKFNGNINVLKMNYQSKPVVLPRYEGRAEFFVQNYSLLLQNVRHSDSGVYTAVVSEEQDQKVAEYKIMVQDAVSVPNLTVIPESNNSDFCNFAMTCSTEDLNISSSFTCNAQNCSQVEEKSLKATNTFSSLIVYLEKKVIICNHSNHVSWNQSNKPKPYCGKKPNSSGGTTIAISTSVSLFMIACIACIACIVTKWKRKNNNKEPENTVYEVPQDIILGQTQDQTSSRDTTNLSPTSTYAVVEFHTGPQSAQTRNNSQPETVYAQVDRSAKSNSRAQQSTPRDEKHR